MLIFEIFENGSSTFNFNCSDNIAQIIKCYISKSKLALSTCNGVYFSSTAFIVFRLYEIIQVKFFWDTRYISSNFSVNILQNYFSILYR